MGNCCSCLYKSKLHEYSEQDLTLMRKTESIYSDYITICRFCDFYDGDTASIVFHDKNGILTKKRFRCAGYDSPEMKPPKDMKNREQHIEYAKEAKQKFIEFCKKEHTLFVHFRTDDELNKNYGRLLGDIYGCDGMLSMNHSQAAIEKFFKKHHGEMRRLDQYMIANTKSVMYNGGKRGWDEPSVKRDSITLGNF